MAFVLVAPFVLAPSSVVTEVAATPISASATPAASYINIITKNITNFIDLVSAKGHAEVLLI